jgi:hypothetical protein
VCILADHILVIYNAIHWVLSIHSIIKSNHRLNLVGQPINFYKVKVFLVLFVVKMKIVLSALFIGFASLVHAKRTSVSDPGFTGIAKVTCDGINSNDLDDLSKTVIAQALEETYDELQDSQKKGTYVKVDWVCTNCWVDDVYRRRRRPGFTSKSEQEDSTSSLEFTVDWICGDKCPGEDFLATSFLESTGIRGANNDNTVQKWEKRLIRALIDTRRADFRAGESCAIKIIPSDVMGAA